MNALGGVQICPPVTERQCSNPRTNLYNVQHSRISLNVIRNPQFLVMSVNYGESFTLRTLTTISSYSADFYRRFCRQSVCAARSRLVSHVQVLLTYCMVHSPSWAANRFAASQEIPPPFHGTRKFITAFTSVRHLSILNIPIPERTILILSYHPQIGLPSCLLPSVLTQW